MSGKIWIGDPPVVIGSLSDGLTHASRYTHRTIPKFHRLMRLRRKINVDLRRFTPMAALPLRHRKYWRIVREI